MDREFKVVFSGEDKNLNKIFREIAKEANSTFNGIAASVGKTFSKSSDYIKELRKELDTIQKQNQMAFQGALQDLSREFSSGKINEQQYRQQYSRIHTERATDRQTERLMRELLEVERESLGVQGDHKENNETFQRTMEGLINGIGRIANAPNMYQGVNAALPVASQMMTSNPIINGVVSLVSGLVEKGFEQATVFEKSAARLGGIAGTKYKMFTETGAREVGATDVAAALKRDYDLAAEMGFTRSGALDVAVQASRAQGYARSPFNKRTQKYEGGALSGALDIMRLTKGGGLEMGQSLELMTLLRGTGLSATGAANKLIGGNTQMRGGDLSLLPEYLNMLVQIGNEQLKQTGEVNIGVNSKMINAISRMDESFKNPNVLGGVVQGLRGGLDMSSSKQVQALQFGVLSRMAPGKSLFKYREMMEDPFSKESQQYLPDFLKELESLSGGNKDMYADYISQVFFGGKKLGISKKIAEGGKLSDLMKEIGTGGGVDFAERAKAGYGTSDLESMNTKVINMFQDNGEKMKVLIDKLTEFIDGGKKPSFVPEYQADNAQAVQYEKSMKELKKSLDSIPGKTKANPTYVVVTKTE